MALWMLKAAVQGILSHLPWGRRLNTFMQEHITGRLRLTPHRFERRLEHCTALLGHYARLRPGHPTPSVLELGTGWSPVLPVALHLCGVPEVWTIDIEDLLSTERVHEVFDTFLKYTGQGTLTEFLPGVCDDRLAHLKAAWPSASPSSGPAGILEQLRIHAIIGDARATGLPSASVGYIVSHWVLEHIAPAVILDILKEFRRLAAPDGLMCHVVDLSDHYCHTDTSLSPLNYLRFPEQRWRFLNNSLHYQNRLRLSDYRRLHEQAGCRIVYEETTKAPESALEGLRLAPEYETYARDDLLTTGAWIVSEPA